MLGGKDGLLAERFFLTKRALLLIDMRSKYSNCLILIEEKDLRMSFFHGL